MRCGFLLDRDRRAQTLDHIHIGLVHELQELARVGREALHVAALSFGIQGIEGQTRLARTTQAGDDDELVARNVEVDVLQVVRARTADADGLLAQGAGQVSAVGKGIQGGICSGKPDMIVKDRRNRGQSVPLWPWRLPDLPVGDPRFVYR